MLNYSVIELPQVRHNLFFNDMESFLLGPVFNFVNDIEFSPEDACRSEMSFLIEILAAVIEAGATTLNASARPAEEESGRMMMIDRS